MSTITKPRFKNVSCSQCGRDFGPGDHGFSHCESHRRLSEAHLVLSRPAWGATTKLKALLFILEDMKAGGSWDVATMDRVIETVSNLLANSKAS